MLNRGFVVLCFSVFIAAIGVGIITPMLPIYIKSLGASGFTLGVIFSSFSLSMAILTPFIGRSSDKIGKKLYITCGFALSTVIALSYVWVSSPSQLILVRFLNGISIAMILPIIMAYIGDITPPGSEGSYMGVYSMSMFLGMAAGPVLGGIIVDRFNMAHAFYALAGGMGIAFLITLLLLPSRVTSSSTAISKSPGKEILASGPLKGLLVFSFILAIAQSGLMVFLPLLAHNQKLSMSQIGILASVFIFTAGIMQAPFGWLANRWNKGKLVVSSTFLVGVWLIFLPFAHGFFTLLCLGTLLGITSAIGVPSANAMIVEHSRKIGIGVVSGTFNSSNNMGNIIGPITAGIVMDVININYAFYLIASIFIVGTIVFYIFAREVIISSPVLSSHSKSEDT
jgi:MFS transporter, DHA1 family, multidrug resistance protein